MRSGPGAEVETGERASPATRPRSSCRRDAGVTARAVDARPGNSILAAGEIDFGGAAHDLIWDVFRNRGMGYFAAATTARTAAGRGLPGPHDADGPRGTVDGSRHRRGLGPSLLRVSASASPATPRRPKFGEYLADETDGEGRYTMRTSGPGPTRRWPSSATAGSTRRPRATSWSPRTRPRPATSAGPATGGAVRRRRRSKEVATTRAPPLGCSAEQALDQSQGTRGRPSTRRARTPATRRPAPLTVVLELPRDDRRKARS